MNIPDSHFSRPLAFDDLSVPLRGAEEVALDAAAPFAKRPHCNAQTQTAGIKIQIVRLREFLVEQLGIEFKST
jgi:hypothetical protein